jgi:S-DNA-T family DNA segregation ATPase FtsK/SpoIIIE
VPVRLREIAESDEFQGHRSGIPVMLGKEATGAPLLADLTRMPHLLIAGQTGAGKSVCINSLLLSILLSRRPSDVRLLLVDPKQVELGFYADIPHLMLPVVTDMKAAARILDWAVQEMEERYEIFSKLGVRSLVSFNKLGADEVRSRLEDKKADPLTIHRWARKLPYIVIVIDELADLMMVAAKEVEAQITRLAQKSRAIGIHLILATQRPSVDVITGLIKANIPCRISFQVACKIDSRTILDGPGAEKLLGRGDLLYRAPGSSFLHRSQGAFVDDDEVQRVVDFLKDNSAPPEYNEELFAMTEGSSSSGSFEGTDPSQRDDLYEQAVRVILENQRGSVSLLQRKLQIGYTRAAKLIDFMQEDGVVGEPNGSKAREIMMTLEEWERRQSGVLASDLDDEDDFDDFDDDDDDDEFDDDDEEDFEDEDDFDDGDEYEDDFEDEDDFDDGDEESDEDEFEEEEFGDE